MVVVNRDRVRLRWGMVHVRLRVRVVCERTVPPRMRTVDVLKVRIWKVLRWLSRGPVWEESRKKCRGQRRMW